MNRRHFLKAAAAGAAAGTLVPRWLGAAAPSRATRLGPIGIQLHTVRREMARDVEQALAMIAGIGYREVEFAGLFNHSARDVRAMLDRHGLVAPSSHVAVPDRDDDWKRALDDAVTLGQSWIVCPWIDEKDRTADGYKRVAARFNWAAQAAKDAGLQFAYHNHDFEFKPINGRPAFDLLLAECDASLVKMEMDIFWLVNGGQDPLDYLARYPGRFPMLHVKDRSADGRMVDVGAGVIPFGKIFAQAHASHYFVEHDEPADAMASARASYAWLRKLEF
ncbi:MAG TPA: sugar phosphate isomerase/epimerase [Gemmatimonadaceae bacterium]|nr:sugar phosphate isomerase/epimerase [Gemmatimonadaceae bacterium]